MHHKFKNRKLTKIWLEKYDARAPKSGDLAPDFELRDVNGDNPVHLYDLIGEKPVGLIFGSFT